MGLKNKYDKANQEINQARQELTETRQELDQRQQLLMNYERDINQKILDYQQAQHAEIRRQFEQSVDFAIRTLPWYQRFSIKHVFGRADMFYKNLQDSVILKSIQAMAEEIKQSEGNQLGDLDAAYPNPGEATADMILAKASNSLGDENGPFTENAKEGIIVQLPILDTNTFEPTPEQLKQFSDKIDQMALDEIMTKKDFDQGFGKPTNDLRKPYPPEDRRESTTFQPDEPEHFGNDHDVDEDDINTIENLQTNNKP